MTQFQAETTSTQKVNSEPVIVAKDVEKWYDNGFHVLKGRQYDGLSG
jgi:general L-amino acid transport system ATP-binding protein